MHVAALRAEQLLAMSTHSDRSLPSPVITGGAPLSRLGGAPIEAASHSIIPPSGPRGGQLPPSASELQPVNRSKPSAARSEPDIGRRSYAAQAKMAQDNWRESPHSRASCGSPSNVRPFTSTFAPRILRRSSPERVHRCGATDRAARAPCSPREAARGGDGRSIPRAGEDERLLQDPRSAPSTSAMPRSS